MKTKHTISRMLWGVDSAMKLRLYYSDHSDKFCGESMSFPTTDCGICSRVPSFSSSFAYADCIQRWLFGFLNLWASAVICVLCIIYSRFIILTIIINVYIYWNVLDQLNIACAFGSVFKLLFVCFQVKQIEVLPLAKAKSILLEQLSHIKENVINMKYLNLSVFILILILYWYNVTIINWCIIIYKYNVRAAVL